MTNNELNKYIKHYLEKDHTGRAIMLTGAWGIGKSFYIRNSLIPYLAKPENNAHRCIVVSLYGLSDLSEISKAIYLEARVKSSAMESETARATILAGKTVIKGVASFFGINLSVNEQDLKELYESIDLTGKLVVFEDVERTDINLLQFLGYVNSLTEQDSVKVLLVTNENELIKYEEAENPAAQGNVPQRYTKDTEKYIKTKEKTVGDTIVFSGDFKNAVQEIIEKYDNLTLKQFSSDQHVASIIGFMKSKKNKNLRSLQYACQKTVDIYERVRNIEALPNDFVMVLFYGIILFTLSNDGKRKVRWTGTEYYSLELGSQEYPLFRFCFDYIVNQHLDEISVTDTVAAFEKLKAYNHNKANPDPDLALLENYFVYSEKEVKETVRKIESRLHIPEDVAFQDYGRIAGALITIKHKINIEVEDVKRQLVENIRSTEKEIDEDEIIWFPPKDVKEEATLEYEAMRDEILRIIYEKDGIIPEFEYLPEQAESFKAYVSNNIATFQKKHGFARFLDIKRLVDMYSHCTPEQMNNIYLAFFNIYHSGSLWSYFRADKSAIEELIKELDLLWKNSNVDSVQRLQYQKFIEELTFAKTII